MKHMGDYPVDVPSRLIGMSERWRDNSTGTRAFFVLWVPVWWQHFTHSTALFD